LTEHESDEALVIQFPDRAAQQRLAEQAVACIIRFQEATQAAVPLYVDALRRLRKSAEDLAPIVAEAMGKRLPHAAEPSDGA
jgi:hypothetical protein